MRSLNFKYAAPLAVFAILGGFGVVGWAYLNSDADQRSWLFADPKSELTLLGNVDVRQVNLSFKVGGRIALMKFEEGDTVKADQLVAALEKGDFEDEMRLAQARVKAQAAVLARLKEGTRPEEIAQARALVE